MKFNRINTITSKDVLYEISFTLQQNYNQTLMTYEDFKEKYKGQSEKMYPYFNDTLESMRLIDTIDYKKHPDYQFLFEPFIPGSDVGVSQLISLDHDQNDDETFLKLIDLHFQEIPTLEVYYAWIQEEELSEAAKYRLMLLGTSRPMIVDKYIAFMKQFETIAEQIRERMAPKAKAFIDGIDPDTFVEQSKGIGLDFDGFEVLHVSALVIGHNALRVLQHEQNNKEARVSVGIDLFEIWKIREATSAEKELFLRRLKMVSDPTKFEILLFCHKTERYGKEIAAHLSLSEATVSHHMQQLLSEQFVSIRVQKNRTYYSTKKHNVMSLMDNLDGLLR